jgi:hypothetical protein
MKTITTLLVLIGYIALAQSPRITWQKKLDYNSMIQVYDLKYQKGKYYFVYKSNITKAGFNIESHTKDELVYLTSSPTFTSPFEGTLQNTLYPINLDVSSNTNEVAVNFVRTINIYLEVATYGRIKLNSNGEISDSFFYNDTVSYHYLSNRVIVPNNPEGSFFALDRAEISNYMRDSVYGKLYLPDGSSVEGIDYREEQAKNYSFIEIVGVNYESPTDFNLYYIDVDNTTFKKYFKRYSSDKSKIASFQIDYNGSYMKPKLLEFENNYLLIIPYSSSDIRAILMDKDLKVIKHYDNKTLPLYNLLEQNTSFTKDGIFILKNNTTNNGQELTHSLVLDKYIIQDNEIKFQKSVQLETSDIGYEILQTTLHNENKIGLIHTKMNSEYYLSEIDLGTFTSLETSTNSIDFKQTEVEILISNLPNGAKICLTDLLGVMRYETTTNTLNIQNLPIGVYLIGIFDQAGVKIGSHKFAVSR